MGEKRHPSGRRCSHSLNGGNVEKRNKKLVDALYASHDRIPFLDFSRRTRLSCVEGDREYCPLFPQSGAPPKGSRVLAAIYPAQIDS